MPLLKRYASVLLLFVVLTVVGCGDSPDEASSDNAIKTIVVDEPYAYATTTAQRNGAVFFALKNNTDSNNRLIGVQSTAAKMVQIHTMDMSDGIMDMRQIDGVDIAPTQSVEFVPSGKHIMLMGLNAPLLVGDTLNLMLQFERGADVTVVVPIRAPYTPAPE